MGSLWKAVVCVQTREKHAWQPGQLPCCLSCVLADQHLAVPSQIRHTLECERCFIDNALEQYAFEVR